MGIFQPLNDYYHWLHGQWPAGRPEQLPIIDEHGRTNMSGVYIVGDLTGIPLLKFAADSGAKAVKNIVSDKVFFNRPSIEKTYDLLIIGGGVSGYAAALEARKHNLNCLVLEASENFSTIKNFPVKKPIFTYPFDMKPEGELRFSDDDTVKEELFDYLKQTVNEYQLPSKLSKVSHIEKSGDLVKVTMSDTGEDTVADNHLVAHRVIIAIGKSGNFRSLNVEGEKLSKVVNRLHDPATYVNKKVAVLGGGDTALEAVTAIARSQGLHLKGEPTPSLTLIHRGASFPKAKEKNVESVLDLEKQGRLRILRSAKIERITDDCLVVRQSNNTQTEIENNAVLSLIGREAPLDFFRKSGIRIQGDSNASGWLLFSAFFLFVVMLYDWKNYGFINVIWSASPFPDQVPSFLGGVNDWWSSKIEDRSSLLGTLAVSMKSRSFYYTVLYTSCIAVFGWLRVRKRKTAYVRVQTSTLFLVQFIPLFLLPEIVLPWLGYQGAYDFGVGKQIADSLFPSYISADALAAHQWPDWGHPRAYWHAYGFILAWPLNVYNVFTSTPIVGWLVISFVQTFVLIPALIYKFGKGAYCGWICSCGALAETLGDSQRHKMPHGPGWNKLNILGQILLLVAFILLIFRVWAWVFPESWLSASFNLFLTGENQDYALVNPFSWKWTVDVLLGGILGVGLYFKYSGRVWCRFACPLAALMNVYSRFSRFRIFSNKEKCISCNQCTSVCHQGIDVMAFANQGKPMEDPQCVRCSACVQTCPTGVLQFGEIDISTGKPKRIDKLNASAIRWVDPNG